MNMKFTLGKKLGMGFATVLALMIISAVLSCAKSSHIREIEEQILTVRIPLIQHLGSLADRLDYAGNNARHTILAATEPQRREIAQKAFEGAWQSIDEEISKLDELTPRMIPENRAKFAEVKQNVPSGNISRRNTVTPMMDHASRTQVPYDMAWRNILEAATLEVFEMMAGVRLSSPPTPEDEPRGEQTAMVGLAGALCGMATIRCSSATAAKLAARMLGDDATSNPSMVADALGELCNMVAGNFKAKVQSLADHCVLSVPTVISGEDYEMQTPEPSVGCIFALAYDGDPVWIALVVHV
ncbi:MAG: chemotaxis protein CheX [Candidatus Acidiferrales bacterium]